MKNIKKLFANNMNEVKSNMKEYPATYLVTIVVTLVLAVLMNIDDMPDSFEKVVYFAVTSIFVYWLSDIVFKKWIIRIIGYVVATGAGITWAIVLDKYANKNIGVYRILAGYLVVFLCLCIYFIMSQMNVNSFKYLLDVFQNLFTYTMFYIVINIGLTSVLLIFINLILDTDSINLIFRLQVLLLGWFSFPSYILAFTKKKSHITAFIKNLVKYVLYPITLVAIVIIYVYMIKLLFCKEIPANSIYEIVAYIFVYGFTTYIMVRNYSKDNKFYELTTKILPWIFIPLIILQSYSIIVRVVKYGCTVGRYLGIAFVIIELVILALNLYTKKDKLDKAILIIAIIAIIASMSPFNAERVSVESQVKLLVKEWPKGKSFDELSEDKKEDLSDRYNYLVLQNNKYKKIYIDKYTSGKNYIDIKKLKSYLRVTEDDKDDTRYYGDFDFEMDTNVDIDISKYKKVQIIEESYEDDKTIYKEVIIELIKKHGKDLEKEIKKDNIVKIDDKTDLYIDKLEVYYYTEKEDASSENTDSKNKDKKDKKKEDTKNVYEGRTIEINSYNLQGLVLKK